MNVLSGETGAGKSIFVRALELLLGGRGSVDLIRQGEEESEVTGLINSNGEELSLRRVISRSGKNRAYLNERPVPVSTLESAGVNLVDLAGQHEHQVLLNPEKHLELLDEYAGVGEVIASYHVVFERYRQLRSERDGLAAREREAREKEEFLRFQLGELASAKVQEGEEESLLAEREILKHAVRLSETCLKGEESLESGEDSVVERLARLEREMRQVSQIDASLEGAAGEIGESLCRLQEVARLLRRYGERVASDPERLQSIEDRLDLIGRLKKKYGGSVEGIRKKEGEVREALALLENFDAEIEKRDEALARTAAQLKDHSMTLTSRRKKGAQKISREVEAELKALGMVAARFVLELRPLTHGTIESEGVFLGESGSDEGEFLMAPNLGEGLHPLAKIASGGEVSRVFLAIKKVLGVSRSAGTCVFDEVDAGIGGRVAEVVGKNLAELSTMRQVVCITHLPQIACYAHHHYVIQKRTEQGRTLTRVRRLQEGQREEEIARMLAGIRITEQAKAHAREMIKTAGLRNH